MSLSPNHLSSSDHAHRSNNDVAYKYSESVTTSSSSTYTFGFHYDTTFWPTGGSCIDSTHTNTFYIIDIFHDFVPTNTTRQKHCMTSGPSILVREELPTGGDHVLTSMQDSSRMKNMIFFMPPKYFPPLISWYEADVCLGSAGRTHDVDSNDPST